MSGPAPTEVAVGNLPNESRHRPPRAPDFEPGRNCWRVETADRMAFIVDAADYFDAVRAAMLKARHRIMLIGWDFDPRIRLGDPRPLAAAPTARDGKRAGPVDPGDLGDLGDSASAPHRTREANVDEGPQKVGDFFLWLADRTPSLEICLLRWDTGAFKALLRGDTLITVLRWMAHPRITLKLDAFHPFAASHHQKIVVIDDQIAFCGGIDVTTERWDRREHADDDPQRRLPNGKSHGPWHDATSAITGPAARALGDLCRTRWQRATGQVKAPVDAEGDCWPADLEPTFQRIDVAVARTLPEMEGAESAHEIEAMYLDLIASATRTVYLESQYFASPRIARAIAERLAEADGPECVIINPHESEGWLEPIAMDTARARLVEAVQRVDRYGRFRLYHPVTAGGREIYVHAKVVVIDDVCLRVGSSNLNNRSMRLDTECDVVVSASAVAPVAGGGASARGADAASAAASVASAAADADPSARVRQAIAGIRDDLLAEHLGVTAAEVATRIADTGSLIAAIEALRGPGRSLVPYVLPELSETEQWLADNEILDPEGPDMVFESLSKRGLFRGWRGLLARHRAAPKAWPAQNASSGTSTQVTSWRATTASQGSIFGSS